MRTLCLLLILANVLYFTWSQMIDVQVNALDRAPPRVAEPPPRIVLAHEAKEPTQETVETEPTEQRDPPEIRDVVPPRVAPVQSPTQSTARLVEGNQFTCTSVGPFADLAEATQAQAALRGAGFEPCSATSEAAPAKSPIQAVAIARLERELGSAASAPASRRSRTRWC